MMVAGSWLEWRERGERWKLEMMREIVRKIGRERGRAGGERM